MQSNRYTVTATNLLDRTIQLNGSAISAGATDDLPQQIRKATPAGTLVCAPPSIAFLEMLNAQNRWRRDSVMRSRDGAHRVPLS